MYEIDERRNFVPKLPSIKIIDLIKVSNPKAKLKLWE